MKSGSQKMKLIDQKILSKISEQAGVETRLRCNFNFHHTLQEPVQRFCNAIEPGSYVRPHRHSNPVRWEFVVALTGSVVVLIFNEHGCITERLIVAKTGPVFGVEIPPAAWHTIASLEQGTVIFEFKEGPYIKASDKDFAHWAPPEGHIATTKFVTWYETASPGDEPPHW
jgi:cupin fold WbuC family metalloprotein